uniref:Uncharacterized protein n=1 Tax=Vespula pensylvanica TaxID=30213 RepID=A0A834P2E7_VESPE|nr:hypothetical protein H0235_008080 [Vespula pensylvanica]
MVQNFHPLYAGEPAKGEMCAVGKCDAARREWMRTNHSINSVLYDPLDAILSNKADATYALNIAVTNATFDSVSSNIDVV